MEISLAAGEARLGLRCASYRFEWSGLKKAGAIAPALQGACGAWPESYANNKELNVTVHQIPTFRLKLLMNCNLRRASSSPDGARSRQIAAAAANSGPGSAKDSMVIQPLYSISLSAVSTPRQSTCPVPGMPRSFSEIWTCPNSFEMARTEFAGWRPSMLA